MEKEKKEQIAKNKARMEAEKQKMQNYTTEDNFKEGVLSAIYTLTPAIFSGGAYVICKALGYEIKDTASLVAMGLSFLAGVPTGFLALNSLDCKKDNTPANKPEQKTNTTKIVRMSQEEARYLYGDTSASVDIPNKENEME